MWRQKLPATAARKRAYTAVSGSAGESQTLSDVLFGDVYLCGGQSNMQFAMGAIENSTTEIAKADGFPTVRLFTVGQDTESAHALHDLQTIEQNWSVASSNASRATAASTSPSLLEFGTTISAALSPTGDVADRARHRTTRGTPVEKWSDSPRSPRATGRPRARRRHALQRDDPPLRRRADGPHRLYVVPG